MLLLVTLMLHFTLAQLLFQQEGGEAQREPTIETYNAYVQSAEGNPIRQERAIVSFGTDSASKIDLELRTTTENADPRYSSRAQPIHKNKDLQRELDLTDEQVEQLALQAVEFHRKLKDLILSKVPSVSALSAENREDIQFEFLALHAECSAQEAQVLLPHQNSALETIRIRQAFASQKLNSLSADFVAEAIGLSAGQRASIQTARTEFEDAKTELIREFRERLKELEQKRRDAIDKVLTPEQESKIEQIKQSSKR